MKQDKEVVRLVPDNLNSHRPATPFGFSKHIKVSDDYQDIWQLSGFYAV